MVVGLRDLVGLRGGRDAAAVSESHTVTRPLRFLACTARLSVTGCASKYSAASGIRSNSGQSNGIPLARSASPLGRDSQRRRSGALDEQPRELVRDRGFCVVVRGGRRDLMA